MYKIDFRKIEVEYRIGEPIEMDVRHVIGNMINQNTSDIGLMDFARKIYYSNEPVEIPEEHVVNINFIIKRCETVVAPVKVAVIALLNEYFNKEKEIGG